MICSRCQRPHYRLGYRYCRECHATYMRGWRKAHPLAFDREKDNARSYAGIYKKRGKLVPQPCETCGFTDVQMHHDDYSKPLEVRWLCRECHLAHHQNVRRVTLDAHK